MYPIQLNDVRRVLEKESLDLVERYVSSLKYTPHVQPVLVEQLLVRNLAFFSIVIFSKNLP